MDLQTISSSGQTTKTRNLNLRVYNSFEEADAAEILEEINKDPLQRIKETVALIMRVYNVTEQSLKERRGKLRIRVLDPTELRFWY